MLNIYNIATKSNWTPELFYRLPGWRTSCPFLSAVFFFNWSPPLEQLWDYSFQLLVNSTIQNNFWRTHRAFCPCRWMFKIRHTQVINPSAYPIATSLVSPERRATAVAVRIEWWNFSWGLVEALIWDFEPRKNNRFWNHATDWAWCLVLPLAASFTLWLDFFSLSGSQGWAMSMLAF